MNKSQYIFGICLLLISIIISADQVKSEFDKLDIDRDGFISHNETQADDLYSAQWITSDLNKDDKLSRNEYNLYITNNKFIPAEQYAEEC